MRRGTPPPGSVVRVTAMHLRAAVERRRLVGQAGVLVDFPAAKRREMFQPYHLEPADPPPKPVHERKYGSPPQ